MTSRGPPGTLRRVMPDATAEPTPSWHEVHFPDGSPRPLYTKLLRDLGDLRPADLRALDDRMEATLREMGVRRTGR